MCALTNAPTERRLRCFAIATECTAWNGLRRVHEHLVWVAFHAGVFLALAVDLISFSAALAN